MGARRSDYAEPVIGRWICSAAFFAVLGFGASACAATRVSLREGPREYVATDYEDVLDKWTESSQLITLQDLDNLLQPTATFESWDFRWAYVIRYVDDYRVTIDQRKKLLETTLEETQNGHHFFVAITGGERRQNDLTKPDSAWIVRLIDSTGNEIAPEDIKIIKRPNAIERTYYPYITVFHQVFRIRFPKVNAEGKPSIAPTAEWFGLRFAGAQGSTELLWEQDLDEPAQVKTAPAETPADTPAPSPSPEATQPQSASQPSHDSK